MVGGFTVFKCLMYEFARQTIVMNILITGATGYIGHQLVLKAVSEGYHVNILVRDPNSENVPKHPSVESFPGDVGDKLSIQRAMRGCEHVIHAAGITRLQARDKDVFYKINVDGTRNMLQSAFEAGVRKFIFTSSCAVLGRSFRDPVTEADPRLTAFENDYEISKFAAEELVREYCKRGLQAVIVSPSRVYGPGLTTDGNPITSFISRTLKRGFAFVPSCKDVVGNYVFIDDVVNGHFLALNNGRPGEKYNLGGINMSYGAFFEAISRMASSPVKFYPLPKWILQAVSISAMISSRIAGRETHLSPSVITRLFQHRAVSSEKAINEFGYKITELDDGLAKTFAFLNSNGYERNEQVRLDHGGRERLRQVPVR